MLSVLSAKQLVANVLLDAFLTRDYRIVRSQSRSELADGADTLRRIATIAPHLARPWDALIGRSTGIEKVSQGEIQVPTQIESPEYLYQKSLKARPTSATTWANYARYCQTTTCTAALPEQIAEIALTFGPHNMRAMETILSSHYNHSDNLTNEQKTRLEKISRRYLNLNARSAIQAAVRSGYAERIRPLLARSQVKLLERALARRADQRPIPSK